MPDPSHQTLTVLNSNYSSEEGVVDNHNGQFIPGGYLSPAIHIRPTLAGIEPTTFLLLVRRARGTIVGVLRRFVVLILQRNNHEITTFKYQHSKHTFQQVAPPDESL